MKKLMNKISFAVVGLMASGVSALAAGSSSGASINNQSINKAICDLMAQFGGIFSTLRLLAFVGAAFIIANWAWGYISKPDGLKLDDVKTKGIGMLIGFIMLFSLGGIISIFMSMAGDGGSLGCQVADMFN